MRCGSIGAIMYALAGLCCVGGGTGLALSGEEKLSDLEDGGGGAALLDEVAGVAGDVEEDFGGLVGEVVGANLVAEGRECVQRLEVRLDVGAREEGGLVDGVGGVGAVELGGEEVRRGGDREEEGLVGAGKRLEGCGGPFVRSLSGISGSVKGLVWFF